jgi:hypothetical protein
VQHPRLRAGTMRCQKETLLDLRDPGARYAPPRRDSGSSPLRSPGQPPKLK